MIRTFLFFWFCFYGLASWFRHASSGSTDIRMALALRLRPDVAHVVVAVRCAF